MLFPAWLFCPNNCHEIRSAPVKQIIHHTNDSGLPTAVVSRGVSLVQLKTEVFVPPSEKKRRTKRSQATILRIRLLVVADRLHNLFHWHRLLVSVEVSEEFFLSSV